MKMGTVFGYIESKIDKYPLHEILDNNKLISNLHDDDLKFYFVLDRYVYTKVDTETNEKKIQFDSGYYCKKYDRKFSGHALQHIQEFAIRTFSLHTFILNELLPFIAIGITKKTQASMSQIKLTSINDFRLYTIREKWNYLENDLKILEQNIIHQSSLQKALIWFTLAKLSNTRIESFMNFYRGFEELSREFNENLEKQISVFVKSEFPKFNRKTINEITKSQKIRSSGIGAYLISYNIKPEFISEINDFRNKQIAHGNDYKIEYKKELMKINDEMENILYEIITQRIKKLKIEGLKNPDFLYTYEIIINKSKRKVALADINDTEHLMNELEIHSYILGKIAEKDIFSSDMLKHIETEDNITINKDCCKKLIKNFGKYIDY